MTGSHDSIRIYQLQHGGFVKVAKSCIQDEGYEGSLLVRLNLNTDEPIKSIRSYLKIAIKNLMTRFSAEYGPDWDFMINDMTITNRGDTHWIKVDFRVIPFPSDNKTESED